MTSYKELLAQRETLNKQIEEARKVEVSSAILQVKELIKEFGLTAQECGFSSMQAATNEAKKPVPVYYRIPDGTEWSGRGRTPVAIQKLVDAGQQLEEFLTEEGKVWFAAKKAKENK